MEGPARLWRNELREMVMVVPLICIATAWRKSLKADDVDLEYTSSKRVVAFKSAVLNNNIPHGEIYNSWKSKMMKNQLLKHLL